MSYSPDALNLQRPSLADLPRIEDRVSFLFLDRCRVEQGRTGLESWQEVDGHLHRTAIPAAALAVLTLGPGTSITAPALITLHRSGTVVVFTDAEGLVGYTSARSLASTAKWAHAQARLWADPQERLRLARRMYLLRFPGEDLPDNIPLSTLRGLEGQRVRSLYRHLSAQHRVRGFRRVTQGADDPVNIALNRANALLYGVAWSVCSALALDPALGFIHHGSSSAFVFDLADLYKAEVSIPAAFAASEHEDALARVGTLMRERLHRHQVLPNLIATVLDLLSPGLDPSQDDTDRLLDDSGFVPGLVNWATR